MAAQGLCLDSGQNAVSCNDADCSYGPCGTVTVAGSQTGVAGCLDQNQNPVTCNDPSCTYGDCTSPLPAASTGAMSANSGSTGGGTTTAVSTNGTSVSSLASSLASIGAATYVASNAPAKTTIGLSGISIPSTSTTTLLLLGVAVIAAFVLLKK
jgi:hypothetical protein